MFSIWLYLYEHARSKRMHLFALKRIQKYIRAHEKDGIYFLGEDGYRDLVERVGIIRSHLELSRKMHII